VCEGFSCDKGYLSLVVKPPAAAVVCSKDQVLCKSARDGENEYHITLVNRMEVEKLTNKLCSIYKEVTCTAMLTARDVLRWLKASAESSLPILYAPLGVGACTDGTGSVSVFEVVSWPQAQWWRANLGLTPIHPHVTLGFFPKDVHSASKDTRSILLPVVKMNGNDRYGLTELVVSQLQMHAEELTRQREAYPPLNATPEGDGKTPNPASPAPQRSFASSSSKAACVRTVFQDSSDSSDAELTLHDVARKEKVNNGIERVIDAQVSARKIGDGMKRRKRQPKKEVLADESLYLDHQGIPPARSSSAPRLVQRRQNSKTLPIENNLIPLINATQSPNKRMRKRNRLQKNDEDRKASLTIAQSNHSPHREAVLLYEKTGLRPEKKRRGVPSSRSTVRKQIYQKKLAKKKMRRASQRAEQGKHNDV